MAEVDDGRWTPLVFAAAAAATAAAALGLVWYVSASRRRLPPGPVGWPWLGYLLSVDARAPYETFTALARKYGPVYSVRLGGLLAVFVSDPQLVRHAFSQDVFSGRAPLYLTHGIMKGHGEIPGAHSSLLLLRLSVRGQVKTPGSI